MATKVTRSEVGRLVDDRDALLIDVLPGSAYEMIHLPGAISIALEDIDTEITEIFDQSRPVVVYCYDYQ